MEKGVPIRSISRSLAVLQAVNRHGSLTLMEIAQETALPYPTACRIVQTLLFEGMIEREPARKHYRPTALVHSLSHGFQSDNRLVIASRDHIIALTRKVAWPISITTRVGREMMVRDSTHTLTSLTLNNYYPGYTLPLLECASGQAYLAFMPEDERRALLESLRIQGVDATSGVDTLGMFESGFMVSEIQQKGYATKGRNRFTKNAGKTSSIAVPLFDGDALAGAMSLIFFSSAKRMDDAVESFLPDLQETALAISATLKGQFRNAA